MLLASYKYLPILEFSKLYALEPLITFEYIFICIPVFGVILRGSIKLVPKQFILITMAIKLIAVTANIRFVGLICYWIYHIRLIMLWELGYVDLSLSGILMDSYLLHIFLEVYQFHWTLLTRAMIKLFADFFIFQNCLIIRLIMPSHYWREESNSF